MNAFMSLAPSDRRFFGWSTLALVVALAALAAESHLLCDVYCIHGTMHPTLPICTGGPS